jgi:hypothetical protein
VSAFQRYSGRILDASREILNHNKLL